MKWYHFGMLFAVLLAGSVTVLQIVAAEEQRIQQITRMEYDCLTAAVEAAVYVAFEEEGGLLSPAVLNHIGEVFFQTLAVLRQGASDEIGRQEIQRYVPCIFVFGEQNYYGYACGRWQMLGEYKDEAIPEEFYCTAEEWVNEYLRETGADIGTIRMESTTQGIWEKSIKRKGIFAVYVPEVYNGKRPERVLLYGAAHLADEVYLVTEDGICHIPSCGHYRQEKITESYGSQRESAERGAIPCKWCLQP